MKTVLITGSNGLLGQKLVELFKKTTGYTVVATSLNPDRFESEGYVFELMDVSSKLEVDYITSRYTPDVIIHTAAITQVDTCENNKAECWKVNVEAVEHLVAAAQNHAAHFIFLSTDFVFDGNKGLYDEMNQTAPLNYYGISKLEGEKRVSEMAGVWNIVRTSLVYGINPSLARPNMVVWLKNALENRQNIRINNDQFRTPTWAEDLAEGCFKLVSNGKSGVYHLAGPDYISVLELSRMVADEFGFDKRFITPVGSAELKETGRRPLRGGLSIEKARRDLNYRPSGILESLQRIKEQWNY